MEQVFDYLDTDRDGKLDAAAAHHALRLLGLHTKDDEPFGAAVDLETFCAAASLRDRARDADAKRAFAALLPLADCRHHAVGSARLQEPLGLSSDLQAEQLAIYLSATADASVTQGDLVHFFRHCRRADGSGRLLRRGTTTTTTPQLLAAAASSSSSEERDDLLSSQ